MEINRVWLVDASDRVVGETVLHSATCDMVCLGNRADAVFRIT
jgi:hypothetical protein